MNKFLKLLENFPHVQYVVVFIRLIMGLLFIFSSFFKIIDLEMFGNIIMQYNIIPEVFVPYGAVIIPVLECMIGLFLLIGYKLRATSFIGMVLMFIFTVAIFINVLRGEHFDCGCFELNRLGIGITESVSMLLVVRDIILFLIFMLLFYWQQHKYSIDLFLFRKTQIKDT